MTESMFELSAGYRELQRRARQLAAAAAPLAAEADEATSFLPEVRALLAESGLVGYVVPREYGGVSDRVDPLAVTVIREALAVESSHLDSMFAMQGIGSFGLATAGSDELRRTWLPRIATLDAVPAMALTEPEVGSDLKNISTSVRADGDELVVSGRKSFITNAGDADFYCVLGREDGGYSFVLVPANLSGVSIEKPHDLIAPHVLGDVVLDDVRISASYRIGASGAGFDLALQTLTTFRVSVAGAALGVAESALREAMEHARTRELFGVPLAQLGGVPASLAGCWIDIEAARSLAYRAAARAAVDPMDALTLSSMAKVAATEASGRVVDRCVQIMGRFGLVRGSKIERLYREARPMRIYEGSTEVILDSLAKRMMKRGLL